MARSCPKCFFAAWVIAFCSVSTRTLRSMPLSFATWSRIMFRLTMGICCGAGAAMLCSFEFFCCDGSELEHGIDVGLADLGQRNVEHGAVDVDADLVAGEAEQLAGERLAGAGGVDGAVGLHLDPLSGVLLEVLRLAQRAIEARAGALEGVCPLHRILDVHRGGDHAAEAGAVVERNPPRAALPCH